MHLQGSLFDQADEVRLGPLRGVRRTELGDGAWIDLLPGWLSGADALFEQLAAEVPWQAERRRMYERVVDVPRLLAFYRADDALPHPVLDEARDALSAHYADRAGRTVHHGRALLLPGRPRQRGLARRPDRPRRPRGHDGRHPVRGRAARSAAAPAARRRHRAAPARARRPDRDGRLLPADLGARDPQDARGRRARGSASSSGPTACAERQPRAFRCHDRGPPSRRAARGRGNCWDLRHQCLWHTRWPRCQVRVQWPGWRWPCRSRQAGCQTRTQCPWTM